MGRSAELETPAYLDIERSVSGRRWELRLADERNALTVAQRWGLPELLGRIMVSRGIGPDAVDAYLNPSLKSHLPDPAHLLDMDKAVERIAGAISANEKIAVFGDYDVDGATSSATLKRYFDAIGVGLTVYIPDRLTEGYGPNHKALRKLQNDGVALVITVDCGITSFDVLDNAADAGLSVIVVDHHKAEPRLPKAAAVVNPNRLDDTSPHGQMAAVGVTFLLIVALNKKLRQTGYFAERREPDLLSLLDLVALGTVCDVVPLTGVNRVFTTQGLKVMAQRRNIGLTALSDVSGIDETPAAYHAGFVLGPRVNAGGRVGEAPLGTRLLASHDRSEAMEIARRLDGFNTERKAIETACLEEAIRLVETEMATGRGSPHLIFVAGEGWHPGVIGIVAGRLKERYQRPACVVALEDGIGKGSGRSMEGVDLGAAVIAARQNDLLINGGGHAMAAGFTLSEGNIEAFRAFLDGRISDALGGRPIVGRIMLDGAVSLAASTVEFIESLERLAPYGVGNPEPRFVIPYARIADAGLVGTDHVRLRITGEGGGSLKGIAFRVADQELGAFLLQAKGGMPVHLAGKLKVDRWNGAERPQIIVDDAAEIAAR
ncbi:MAG: single-stranded-DNA-specific exonuclease RecJ [Alphaproteobacteria bacterium]